MKKQVLLNVCLLSTLIVASGARAEFPLILEQEVVGTAFSSFDVGYWLNDSTLGFAWAQEDSITFITQLGEEPRVVHLDPDSLADHRISLFKIFRHDDYPGLLLVAAVTINPSAHSIYISLLTLASGLCLCKTWVNGSDGSDGYYWNYTNTPSDILVWPPPPLHSELIGFTTDYHSSGDYPGGAHTQSSSGGAHVLGIENGRFAWRNNYGGKSMSAYRTFQPPYYLSIHYSSAYVSWVNPPPTFRRLTQMLSFYCTDSCSTGVDTICYEVPQCNDGLGTICATTSANGVFRLFSTNSSARDPFMFEEYWNRAPLTGNVKACYSGRFLDLMNEWVLVQQRNETRLDYYDPITGDLLGSTSSYLGSTLKVLKSQTRLDRIVTAGDWVTGDFVIRVYRLAPLPVWGFVTRYLPTSNSLSFSWGSAEGALSYMIEYAESLNGVYVSVWHGPGNVTSAELPLPVSTTGYFRLVTQFPDE